MFILTVQTLEYSLLLERRWESTYGVVRGTCQMQVVVVVGLGGKQGQGTLRDES